MLKSKCYSITKYLCKSTSDINVSVAPSPICEGQSATLIFTAPAGTAFTADYFENILKTVTVTSAGLSSIVSPNDTTIYTLNYVVDDKGCESN